MSQTKLSSIFCCPLFERPTRDDVNLLQRSQKISASHYMSNTVMMFKADIYSVQLKFAHVC